MFRRQEVLQFQSKCSVEEYSVFPCDTARSMSKACLALDFRFLWVSLAELFDAEKVLPEPISATFSGKSQFQKVNKAWIFCGCGRIWTSYKIRPSLMRPPMPDEAVLNEVELSKTTRRLDSVNWRIYCQFQNRKNGFYTWLFSMRL